MRLLLALAVSLTLLISALWLPEGRREARSAVRPFVARESSSSSSPSPSATRREEERDEPVVALGEPRHDPLLLERFEAARSLESRAHIHAEPSRMPRSTLAGRVFRWDGSPAEGARVEFDCSAPFHSELDALASARTQADGSFRLSGPGSGPFRVSACLDRARVERDGLAAGTEGVELVLPAPCALHLSVVDDRGHPLEAFTLSRLPVRENPSACGDWGQGVVHGEHGALALTDLMPGAWRLHVESPGTCTQELVLTLPTITDPTIVMQRQVLFTGRVLDERGEPVPSAEVEARTELDAFGWESATQKCTSDQLGRFTLTLSPGVAAEFSARRENARSQARRVTLAAGQELELDLGPLFEGRAPLAENALERAALAAAPSASVCGRVLDTDGAPVAGLALDASFAHGFARRTLTDANGAYRLDLASGCFCVRATESAGERAFQPSERFVRLERGENRAGLDFALEPAAVIAGWVRYPPGWKDGMAQVFVRDGAQTYSADADEHGRFRVAPLNGSLHWVSAIGRDALGRPCCTARTFLVEATAGQATSIALELVPATVLSVRPAAGTEFPREAVFEAVDPSGLTRSAHLDSQDRWQFVLAARDPVLLRARSRGRMFERELSFSPGEVEFDFPLK